jgi:hypothetical protein
MPSLRGIVSVAPLLLASAAVACPLCDGDTGAAVRAGIARNLVGDLAAILAPFPILVGIAAWLRFGGTRRR